jgi:hypothetical protein
MGKLLYPGVEDLKGFLSLAGVAITDSEAVRAILDSAIRQWEGATGWSPFLASKDVCVKEFAFPRMCGWSSYGGVRILEFDGGLVELKGLKVFSDCREDCQLLELGKDYWLMPKRSKEKGRPYEWVEFAGGSGWKHVEVEGRWGYSDVVAEDAWVSILKRAACDVVLMFERGQQGGLKSWSEGDVREEYVVGTSAHLVESWSRSFDECAFRYRRYFLGL